MLAASPLDVIPTAYHHCSDFEKANFVRGQAPYAAIGRGRYAATPYAGTPRNAPSISGRTQFALTVFLWGNFVPPTPCDATALLVGRGQDDSFWAEKVEMKLFCDRNADHPLQPSDDGRRSSWNCTATNRYFEICVLHNFAYGGFIWQFVIAYKQIECFVKYRTF